ncbi:MAG TPA: class I SAM-dependent methyltransferase [Nocardioides sp.]
MTRTAAELREALLVADFTFDAVADLLGPTAHRALERNETLPGLRRTTSGSPLDTLVRLFLLQATVTQEQAERALPGLVDRLCADGILERSVGEVAARLDCRPYAADGTDLWVVSDLTPGLDGAPVRVGAEHVLGISSASTSLAQLTIREPVGRALDLGTGCGVQALHLAGHAADVVATDVNQRALRVARINAALNEVSVDVRDGSFFEPVAGERFDLIATNPPFVISPATGERLVYRDSGLPGDRVVEHVVRAGPDHLTDGGWLQVLANWVIERDRPWDERLAGWLRADCDALVVQREVLDPAAYVELWLKDSGHHGGPDYAERYDTWLSWLESERVEGIGFGWINVRLGGNGHHELLEWPYDVEQPIAPAIADWGRVAGATVSDTDRLVLRPDVRQETFGAPGAEDPTDIVLRQQRGFRRARSVDTVEAALVGACDGELTLGQILAALGQILEADESQLRASYLPVAGELVREGFLLRA